ncbi:MAG: antitoxin VapB family protein [Haloarculaceae archaeon]
MSSKNISVREDVYRALKREKGDDESFSDVIERLLERRDGDHPLYDLVDVLDESEAARVRKRGVRFRESVDERMDTES